MALKDILNKIQSIADQEIEKLQHDFEKQELAIIAKYEKETAQELEILEEKTKLAEAAVDKKVATMAHRDCKQSLLKTKRNLLDKALIAFADSIVAMPEAEKIKIYKKLAENINSTEGTVIVAKGESSILENIFGKDLKIEEGDIKGGFIVRADGAETDCSLENLLNSEYKNDLEMYFADLLKLV